MTRDAGMLAELIRQAEQDGAGLSTLRAIAEESGELAAGRALVRLGLTELAVQTSSYGTQVPRLFGTIRVAGCVIWSTDLIETRTSEGGGKGRPGSVQYSYAASFAVALSSRAVGGVRRIWADGKLLRGAAGDFKTQTGFRLHRGDEDQAFDPLIAGAQGVAMTPAWRGVAYAVFENMQLADFGNRIPSLTFEVEAGGAAIGEVAAAIGGGVVRAEAVAAPVPTGFSAHGGSVRAVLESLAEASGSWFASEGGAVTMRHGPGAARMVVDGLAAGGRGVRSIATADTAPRTLTIGHYDAARDYQAGLQRATRPGAGMREANVTLPMVLGAGEAKGVAMAMLARLDAARQRRKVVLGWEAIDISPGDRVRIAGEGGSWRVANCSIEAGMRVVLDLVPIVTAAASGEASSGAVVAAPDREAGATLLVAAELPPIDGAVLAAPRLTIVAGGTLPGWRSAAVLLSDDGGGSWRSVGATRAPAAIGTVIAPPGPAAAGLEDRRNTMLVELAHDELALASADAAMLDRGGNLALVGDELIQFGEAVAVAPRLWRLATLWRGRLGTEAAIDGHVVGERFAWLAADSVLTVDLPASAIGGNVLIGVSGAGDGDAMIVRSVAVDGASVRPPSPVHLRREGGVLRWVRRSRDGWRWIDGVDVPLVEEGERYAVAFGGSGERIIAEPRATGAAGVASVTQVGTVARSLVMVETGDDDDA